MTFNTASHRITTRLWHTLRFDLTLLWHILSRPLITLQLPRLSEYFSTRRILRHYIIPLSILTAIAHLAGSLLTLSDTDPQTIVVSSLFTLITLIATFFVLYSLIGWITRTAFIHDIPRWNIEALTAAVMSIMFAIRITLGLLPSMFFVQFFYIYTFYIVWVATDTIIPIPESRKNRYMVIITLITITAPWLVNRLLHIMVPNI